MDLKQFGEQLRTLRQQAGWSQEALIEALDQLAHAGAASEYRVIDGTLLSRWERAHTQKGRTWKPTRTYLLYLIQLFASHLDLARAQTWAAQAGYTIRAAELECWFPTAAPNGAAGNVQPQPAEQPQPAATPHNLPPLLTSFVGRAAETARVLNYLANSTTRLITVVGEGGAGKTRLALEVAHQVVSQGSNQYRDGVYFVALVGVGAPSFVVSALANTLGLAIAGANDPQQQLLAHLQNRRLLLVLDNFEQLVAEATPLLTAILQAAPGVYLLVTSRERLNLAEEWIVLLAGLPFPSEPPPVGAAPLAALAHPALMMVESYGAVELFVARARQTDDRFDPDSNPQQTAAIVRICNLLQGIPLGIEMAAAWVHMLSCAEIGDEIAQNLDFLTSPHRHLPDRHRSMRAVFEQSWRLLTQPEQTVLAALAVFQGGFTREAAASVTKASLLTLRSLVDKSLLKVTEGRYEMHELLRQFAEEKLQLDQTVEQAVHKQHAAYYGNWLKRDEELWNTDQRPTLVSAVSIEIRNVRSGWGCAVTSQEATIVTHYIQSLFSFYTTVNWFQEGQGVFQYAITALETKWQQNQSTALILSKVLSRYALCSYRLGQFEQAKSYLQKSLRLLEYQEEAIEACLAAEVLGMIHYIQGQYEAAQICFQRSFQDAQKTTDLVKQGDICYKLGEVEFAFGNYNEAYRWYHSSLELYRRKNFERGIGIALRDLGELAEARGYSTEAYQYYQQSLFYLKRVGDREQIARSSLRIGVFAQIAGHFEEAKQWYQKGYDLAEEIHTPLVLAHALYCLGNLAGQQGEYEIAHTYLRSAFDIATRHKTEPLVMQIVLSVATLLLADRTQFDNSQILPDTQISGRDAVMQVYRLLKLVADHPASLFATRDQANTKLSELAGMLPVNTQEMLGLQASLPQLALIHHAWQGLLPINAYENATLPNEALTLTTVPESVQ